MTQLLHTVPIKESVVYSPLPTKPMPATAKNFVIVHLQALSPLTVLQRTLPIAAI